MISPTPAFAYLFDRLQLETWDEVTNHALAVAVQQAYEYGKLTDDEHDLLLQRLRSRLLRVTDLAQHLKEFERPRKTYDSRDTVTGHEQHGGTHYLDKRIQPVDVIFDWGLNFAEGSVIKYVARWRDKGGVGDLRKAIHYLEMLIRYEERENNDAFRTAQTEDPHPEPSDSGPGHHGDVDRGSRETR